MITEFQIIFGAVILAFVLFFTLIYLPVMKKIKKELPEEENLTSILVESSTVQTAERIITPPFVKVFYYLKFLCIKGKLTEIIYYQDITEFKFETRKIGRKGIEFEYLRGGKKRKIFIETIKEQHIIRHLEGKMASVS
jgi:hypothetical protein